MIFLTFEELPSFDIKTQEEATKLTLQLRERDHQMEKLKDDLKGN